ncbi:hypothetical protein BGZ63DRAFT_439621 [Mariannaea sp. PMI_226]|nr:hypothetical protein BGZ63DRAFT_439621 [Mariannaea sp. PMI_226]
MKSFATSCIVLLASISSARAANCFNVPIWEYYSDLYRDSWDARALLCASTGQSTGPVNCTSQPGDSTTCTVQTGSAYAAFTTYNLDEAIGACMMTVWVMKDQSGSDVNRMHMIISTINACIRISLEATTTPAQHRFGYSLLISRLGQVRAAVYKESLFLQLR